MRAHSTLLAALSVGATLGVPLPLLAAQDTEEPFYYEAEELGWALTEEHAVPGVAIARVRDGELAWTLGCGYADFESEEPVTADTVFNIGSISKTVAAWGLMHLVEKGVLELDRPVETYLTRWKLPPSDLDAGGVTLRRLLSHTAGLSLHGYPGYDPAEELPTIEASLRGESNAGELVLIHEPGTKWKYSGGGYTIAQLVVEEATGRGFAEFMKGTVLEPLGMHRSEYGWSESIVAAAATPYDRTAEPIEWPGGGPRFIALAAAGLQTTARDLARFAAASMAGASGKANGVLSPKTVALMQRPADASPNYGLGYSFEEQGGVAFVGHGGANRGWMAEMSIAPALGDAIVVLTNASTGQRLLGPIVGAWREAVLAGVGH